MGRILMPRGGAGEGIQSSDLTAMSGDVIKGKTYMGADTDDGIGTGTLELTGNAQAADIVTGKTVYTTDPKVKVAGTKPTMGGQTVTPSLNQQSVATNGKAMTGNIIVAAIPNQRGQAQTGTFWYGGTYCTINNLPEGYYVKNGASWAPEARCDAAQMRSVLGVSAEKIVRGQTIADIAGTGQSYREYLGRGIRSSTARRQFINSDGSTRNLYYLDLNLGFYPTSVSGVTSDRSGTKDWNILGNDSWHLILWYNDRSIGYYNFDNASGIMWNSTHIYLPAGNLANESWDVMVTGYA